MLGALRKGASLSHAPGPRALRLAAPRLALLLLEQPRSRADPERSPRHDPAAVAAAGLTPGRAEPLARRRSLRLPARPLAGRGTSKARRAAEGEAWGRGRRAGGGAWRGAAGLDTAPPSRLRSLTRAGGWGPGTGDRGSGGDGRRRSSGQEEYWNRHPLGSCPLCSNRSSGSRGCAFPPLYFSWQRTGGLSGSTLQVMKLRSEKRRCLERPQRCPFRCTIGLLQKVFAYYPPRARPPSPPTLYVLI